MKIGVPREIKADEYRVSLTPAGARALSGRGHAVIVESAAGTGSGFTDEAYLAQGAKVVGDAAEVYAESELILGVKEPQPSQVGLLREHHILFTFLHLPADPPLAAGLKQAGAACIGYETVEDQQHRLPLLAPMSEIAGRLAAQAAAQSLHRPNQGKGLLIGGSPGSPPARVLILGGGIVGANAAAVAVGMGASVTVCDISVERLRFLDQILAGHADTLYATSLAIEETLPGIDVVIGAAMVRGSRAPWLLRRQQLTGLSPGSVLVDVSIDQGGCFETSRPTTHSHPTFVTEGVVHYCVANMPGVVPATSTRALTNATLPYIITVADHGLEAALERDPGLRLGLQVHHGRITHLAVAAALPEQASSQPQPVGNIVDAAGSSGGQR